MSKQSKAKHTNILKFQANTANIRMRCLVCSQKKEVSMRLEQTKIVINLNFRETQIYDRTQLTK